MKLPLFPLLVLSLSMTPVTAQNETKPIVPAEPKKESAPVVQQELAPNQRAFLNLPEEKRKEFAKHLGEATRMFQDKRIFETMDELDKAEKIFADTPEIHNLRGSCYVEFRNFEKALVSFREAKKLSPNNPSVDFNIGEVLFVTKQWQPAHDAFEALFKLIPEGNIALGRLVEFKLLLCKKKLGKKNEVIALAEKYDYLDESPYYYFAQAALAYDDGNLVKAEEWLAMSGRIFRDPAILAPWQDTLVEFGYIKSFYGDDEAAPTVPILPAK